MVVMYPLTNQLDYTELRYSLRSIEMYLKNVSEVIIVGNNIPEWATNITQIELPDVRGKKQLSIKRKIAAALVYSKEILFLNDDIYFLKPVTEFPYYYFGELKNYGEGGAKPLYDQLIKLGKPTKNFDNHMPLIYERDKFNAVSNFTEPTIIKSAYCNYHEIEGQYLPDVKLMKPSSPEEIRRFIKNKSSFSTGVRSLQSVLPILEELFPEPSKYEI